MKKMTNFCFFGKKNFFRFEQKMRKTRNVDGISKNFLSIVFLHLIIMNWYVRLSYGHADALISSKT